LAIVLTLSSAAVASTIVAGDQEVASGPTAEGPYSVRAHTDTAGGVCLTVEILGANGSRATPTSCTPQPLTEPVGSTGMFVVPGGKRLITGVVTDAVAAVEVTPSDDPVSLKRIMGVPGAYFDVLVSGSGPVTVVALDASGHVVRQLEFHAFRQEVTRSRPR
jgi:hypothetical protein